MAHINLALSCAPKVDELFSRKSQAALVTNNDYDFTGVKTVRIYNIPVVPLTDYSRTSGFGTPTNLGNSIQEFSVNRDRGFYIQLDRGDYLQSQMVMNAGKVLAREMEQMLIPEYDSYVFQTLYDAGLNAGNSDTSTAITTDNAFASFLAGMEKLGDQNVPDEGRIALVSYSFATKIMQDDAFVRYGDKSQDMLNRGVIGELDGCKIMKVPSARLPFGTAFMITHPSVACAPKQLEEYTIIDKPQGYSGWLIQGRTIYDCFVTNAKAQGIYVHGGQSNLRCMQVMTVGSTTSGQTNIVITSPSEKQASGNKWYFDTADTRANLIGVTAGSAITTGNWTELTANGASVSPVASTDKFCRVVEVDSSNKPVSVGDCVLHLG